MVDLEGGRLRRLEDSYKENGGSLKKVADL